MYLKRLEIFGFKSFADKLEIVFPQGITGVVGPNGSGKSNISDALRWVLGEQSVRSLRGLRTEDVIFAGSEQRKPLGMAEVTLVLDNSDGTLPLDFSEVSITRRVFRSGESDFLINKAAVRLKEIQELFMDTGLGREAYSVIGQGKIEAILSARSEERRAVFEEAAGIMRYKSKKAVAMRKLEETEANLIRVNDIIVELGGQLGPLGLQAVAAQQYLDLTGRLKHLEINCYGKELSRLSDEEAKLTEEHGRLSGNLADIAGAESVEEASLEEARLMLAGLGERLENLQEHLADLIAGLEKSSGSERLLLERKGHMAAERQRYEKSMADLQSRVFALESELQREREGLTAIAQKRAELEGRHSEGERTLAAHTDAIAVLSKRIEDMRQAIVSNIHDLTKARQAMNALAVEEEFIVRQQQEDSERASAVKAEVEKAEHRSGRLREECAQGLAAVEKAADVVKEARQNLAAGERVVQECTASRDALTLKKQKCESRLTALEDMDQAYQGYSQGVRSVLTESPAGGFRSGIRGTVADLVKVHRGYEAAMEVALGGGLQNVVVESERHARGAIDWLKQNGRGRATFLPMDMVEGHERHYDGFEAAMKEFGGVPATSVLDYERQYHPVILFLLSNTVIAQDLEKAVGLSRRLKKQIRVVTLAGDIVNPGGSMSGGSAERKGSGILERKTEMDNLRTELAGLDHELKLSRQRLDDAFGTKARAQTELEACIAQRQSLEMENVRLEKELEVADNDCARLKGQLRQFEDAAIEREAKRAEFGLAGANLAQAVQRLESGGQQLDEELKVLESELKERQSSKEGDYRVTAEFQAALAGIRQEELNAVRTCESLGNLILENQEQIAAIRAELDHLETDEAGGADLLAAELKAREGLETEKTSVEDEIRLLRSRRAEMTENLHRQEDELKGRRKAVTDLEHRVHRLELRLNNLRNESENIRVNLNEDYGPDWAAELDPNWDGTLQSNRARIEGLKSEIRSLGPVNLGAIEEHQRIRERHDFLQIQFDDLTQAKESLQRVIDEIEQTTTRRFLETFGQIREAFITVFNQLFEGGRADLYLLEPDRPLESGIEIEAQPPGKRLQSLTLLSGGERALTAIALLFAILRVRPTPFCILDEIDATLDEANVHRFAELLSSFSKSVQFIVVTHRRGTMEMADALYGVTMEEMGISKLLSLQLKKRAG